MKRRILSKRLVRATGFLSAVMLALYLFGVGLFGWDNGETCTGIGLLLAAGEMLCLGKILHSSPEDHSENSRGVSRRGFKRVHGG